MDASPRGSFYAVNRLWDILLYIHRLVLAFLNKASIYRVGWTDQLYMCYR